MRIYYLLFILAVTVFGFVLSINGEWQNSSNKFSNDVMLILDDFDARLTAKDDLMKRALDSYGTQVHVNKEWIKKTRSDISDKKGLG